MSLSTKARLQFFVLTCLLLPLGSRSSAPSPRPQQNDSAESIALPADFLSALDAICSDLTHEIQKHKFQSVAVFGASWPEDNFSELGKLVGDAVSIHLAAATSGFNVVQREDLRSRLQAQRLSALMANSTSAAQWLAEDLKISSAVLVSLSKGAQSTMTVHVELFDSHRYHALSVNSWHLKLDLSPELSQTLLRSMVTPDMLPKPPDRKQNQQAAATTSYPECVFCPRPDYSQSARDNNWRGDITLSVLVTAQGFATDILLLKEVPFQIDRTTIAAVKNWKFKPATDPNKGPIGQRVQILCTFDLFPHLVPMPNNH